jgi:7-keto-8-aminopelargonate synthetase-like enzyme
MAAQSPIFPPAPPTFGAVTDIMPATAAAKNQIIELMNARERAEQNERAAGPMKHKKTVRRTYQVGRSKKHPVVSVLVSNKTIRKKTMTDIQNLGQVPMHEVKNFLQKKGLIKIGSVAPPRVLRKMYENVFMLGGDIVNHNKDTLLHNFIMGAREENQ